MALKPRKQHRYYPYLFLLNEKTFLRYLRGQYVIFDSCNFPNYYDECTGDYTALFPFDNFIDYYELSQTKQKIFETSYLFKKIDPLIYKLTNENKLTYAPVFCSSWIVNNDNQVIRRMKNFSSNIKTPSRKSREKREVRKELRLNTWCCGWMTFQDKSIKDADLKNPMLTNREQKWWQKGYDDAKKDYEQEKNNKPIRVLINEISH
ncbi:hypothetical protein ACPV3S_15775 [Photobacterium damselae]|uniref:hypothetical protein n=1 Tax=Photobacterium damselae TaxID=38293 RepID=UPI0040692C5A